LGFISAVRDIGRRRIEESSIYQDFDFRFLQLPMTPLFERDQKKHEGNIRPSYVIQVWLSVEDPNASILQVRGIDNIVRTQYLAGGMSFEQAPRLFCYRRPPGNNTSWRYSPVYNLDKQGSNKIDAHIQSIRTQILEDYEKSGLFPEGSVELIVDELTKREEEIEERWSERNRPHIIVFGISHEGGFLYPGEIPAFVEYYRNKIEEKVYRTAFSGFCVLCERESDKCVNLNQVFKFGTFDKPGFLPGTKENRSSIRKVFPICLECFSEIAVGREHIDTFFCDRSTIRDISLYVVPELIFGSDMLEMTDQAFRDFIRNGLSRERNMFRGLARRNEALVYHFVFWEAQQAQERIHLMIEDVPPSHLKQLEYVWTETAGVFELGDERKTLDYALGEVVRVIRSFAGESEQDQKAMQMYAISVIGKLLNNEPVDVKTIKTLAVSRLPGLVHDDKWLEYGSANARRLAAVVDFLNRCARRG